MQHHQIFLSNLPGIGWSIAVSGLYAFSTLALGSRLAPPCQPGWEGLNVAVRFSLGAAAFGLLFTILAMLRMAFLPLVLALALFPGALALHQWLVRDKPFQPPLLSRRPRFDFSVAHIAIAVCIVLLAAYPFALSLAWPRGSDMTIYHLVIPRTVLWNHGLIFNSFSHDAGLYYGWQLYALPAYFMGSDLAFQFCSFIAFAILLFSSYKLFRDRYNSQVGLIGALITGAVICGMSRESIVNNDVPLVLLEITLLGLAGTVVPRRSAALLLGILGGFLIAVKLVAIATTILAYGIFLWRAGRHSWPKRVSMLFIATLASLGPWPIFNHLSSGSPLPHFLLFWPPETGFLPQFHESIAHLMQHFGEWYRKNFFRLFLHGLEFVPALLMGYAILPFSKRARSDALCLMLAAYALLRTLLLLALNHFDPALIFHDRYHLVSYVLLTLGGMLCWYHALPTFGTSPAFKNFILSTAVLLGVAHLIQWSVPSVQVMGKNSPDIKTYIPSLKHGFYSALGRMGESPGGGSGGVAYDFVARFLPQKAVVATTVIDPYLLQRPFLQMLPVSENIIDLSLPPGQLRQAMLAQGATHLHLSQYTGLNPWMLPVEERWLRSLRKIPELPGVRRLIFFNYPTQKGVQGIYELATAAPIKRVEPRRLHDVRLIQEIDGTWAVRWSPVVGADVHIHWHGANDQTALAGEAASDIGEFPIRLKLITPFELEVICFVDGEATQRLKLTNSSKAN